MTKSLRYQLILVLKTGRKIKPEPVSGEVAHSIYQFIADETGKVMLNLGDSKLMLALRNVDYVTSTAIEEEK